MSSTFQKLSGFGPAARLPARTTSAVGANKRAKTNDERGVMGITFMRHQDERTIEAEFQNPAGKEAGIGFR